MPVEYNLLDKSMYSNPYPLYHQLRAQHPVYPDSALGCWVVTSYAGVAAALSDRNLSSERAMQDPTLQGEAWNELSPLFQHISNLMFFSDPPKHTKIRSLVNKALSVRMLEKWRNHIQKIVDAQLDQVQEQGRMDIIQDLAFPLPAQVIADMLGIPDHDHNQFKRWSDDLADFLGNAPTLEICTHLMHSMDAFLAYFQTIVAEHRAQPKDDLVDALIASKEQGVVLAEDELLVNCVGLFAAGHETTTNLIGNGVLALLRHPDELQKLQSNPELIASAVEEMLRYDSPVQFTARKAKQTVEIGGKKIYRGQSVMLMLGAANRDPLKFQEPDRFDIGRQNNHHLALGHNIHYCIGGGLARLEAQIAIETLLKRMPALQLAAEPLQWQENLSFHGVQALPIVF